jgi:hypothetical protein
VTDSLVLAHLRPEGAELVSFQLPEKSDDPQANRQLRDPEAQRKKLVDGWRRQRVEFLPGPSEWLPESDWAPMTVHRFVVALKLGGQAAAKKALRVHAEYYLVLFTRNESLFVSSQTPQDSPIAFRRQVEAMLKTFQLGPSKADEAS